MDVVGRDRPDRPRRRLIVRALAVFAVAGLAGLGLARPDRPAPAPAPSSSASDVEYRQVTLFGIIATPADSSVDPKLEKIQNQLRKLKPGHGFRLVDVSSKRLGPGETLSLDLKGGTVAKAELVEPLNARGKVRFKFTLDIKGRTDFSTFVTTPPNQLFFCEKARAGNERLLIGIGAR